MKMINKIQRNTGLTFYLKLMLIVFTVIFYWNCGDDASTDSSGSNKAPTVSQLGIDGDLRVNKIVNGLYTYSDAENDKEGLSIYKWFSSEYEDGPYIEIEGSENSSLFIAPDKEGQYIKFGVQPVAVSGTLKGEYVESKAFGPVLEAEISVSNNSAPKVSNVSISGEIINSKILTGNYTYSDADGDSEGNSIYKWYISDTVDGTYTEKPGAVSLDFELSADEIGKYIKFEVTPVAASGETTGEAVLSAAVGPVVDIEVPYATDLRITGILQDTNTITGNYTYNDNQGDPEATSIFQWYISDTEDGTFTAISSANAVTYDVQTSDVGKFVVFEVIPVAASGETTGEAKRTPVAGPIVSADAPFATSVNITGTLGVGATLQGNYIYNDNESDPEGLTTFQWYRSDTEFGSYSAIESATNDTYVLQDEDYSKYIMFEVRPIAQSGTLLGAPVKSVPKGAVKYFARITVDGELNEVDWTSVTDNHLTDPDPSINPGGVDNDLQDFYVAWDAENLYLGITGKFGNGDSSNAVVVYIDTEYSGGTTANNLNFYGGTNANVDGSPSDTAFKYNYVWINSWGHQDGADGGLYVRDNTSKVASGVSSVEDSVNKDSAEIAIAWNEITLTNPGGSREIAFLPIISTGDWQGAEDIGWYDDMGQAAAATVFTVTITDGSGNLKTPW